MTSTRSPGRYGRDSQVYEQWTLEELVREADRLGIPSPSKLTRVELELALLLRDII